MDEKGSCEVLLNMEKEVGKVCSDDIVKSKFADSSKKQVSISPFSGSDVVFSAQVGWMETFSIDDRGAEKRYRWTIIRVDIGLKVAHSLISHEKLKAKR